MYYLDMITNKIINKAWLVVQSLPKFQQSLGVFRTRRDARLWLKKNTQKTSSKSRIKILKFVVDR